MEKRVVCKLRNEANQPPVDNCQTVVVTSLLTEELER